jgi:adenylate cyclase
LESLAKAQVRFGAYQEAVANAERALRLHPFAPHYYPYVYGQALYAAGRYEDAENALNECLLRAPEERSCLRMRAAVLVRLDRLDEARTTMARLIELDPTFALPAERETARFGNSPLMERYLADLEAAGAPAAAGQVRVPAADPASMLGRSISSGLARSTMPPSRRHLSRPRNISSNSR